MITKLGIVLLNAVLLLAMPVHPDFSGSWKLDLTKSLNLPGSFKQVEAYTMEIQQTNDSMTIIVGLVGGGQSVKFPVTKYIFDSSEVFREDTLRHSKRWTRCSWEQDGTTLEVTSRVQQGIGEKRTEYVEHDEWKMNGADAFQISVSQKYTGTDSTRTEQRIFYRTK